jgi:hypothetical protein
VIVIGRIRALQRTDLAKFLNLVYVLCMCVSWEIRLDALCESCGLKGRAPERGSKGGAPERGSKGGAPPSVGRRAEPPERGSKGEAPECGSKGRSPRA